MKKIVPKTDASGAVVPGEYIEADATPLDYINPLVPLAGTEGALARAVATFVAGELVKKVLE